MHFLYSAECTMKMHNSQLWYAIELYQNNECTGVVTYERDNIVVIPLSTETLKQHSVWPSQMHSIFMDVDDASRIIVDAIETKYTLCNGIPYWMYMKCFDIKCMCFEEIAIQFDLAPEAKIAL